MEITCPQCQFARTIPDEKIPDRAEMATCPKCKHKFQFRSLDDSSTTDSDAKFNLAALGPEPKQTRRPSRPLSQEFENKPQDGEEFWDKLASLGQPHQKTQDQASSQGFSPSTEIEVPWERLDKYGFFPGLWETIKRAMFQPAAFFQSMPVGSGQIKPLIFYLLIAEFQIIMQMLWGMTGMGSDVTGDAGVAGMNTMMLLLFYPLLMTILLYLMAFLVHACLHLVGGVSRGFEGTFRALTYGSAPMVMVLIPMIGPLVGAIWSLIVTFLGYKHIHRTTTAKVLLAMLLPLILLGLLLVIILAIAQRSTGVPPF